MYVTTCPNIYQSIILKAAIPAAPNVKKNELKIGTATMKPALALPLPPPDPITSPFQLTSILAGTPDVSL